MDPWGNPNIPRGRSAEQAQFSPNGGRPYLQRQELSLSQEDESEVFEDARETWDKKSRP